MASYQRITEHDDAPNDAVTVGIGGEGEDFGAEIWWPQAVDRKVAAGALKGPFPVPEALARAQEIARQNGFNRVVVMIQHADIWNPAWGELNGHGMDNREAADNEPFGVLAGTKVQGQPLSSRDIGIAAALEEQERDA